MVQFLKYKLNGFKSFVEPTEIEIGNGLNGIVGPNGCGKSNLVEALRWVMGETSAKRMRGSGMDDVIFAGTTVRPARNTAEVTVWLDNTDRTAPAEINDSDLLEITRKIERDNGSTYRVNGKVVRAKDIQLLFADCSIGAHSPAMVSQGRIADVINAKPTQRRLILEEAAGISGLHVRRHEAELKLRAAESNLTRVEDVLGTMASQLEGLKKQARQASRYRNLSTHIQQAEAIALFHRWNDTSTSVEAAMSAFERAENIVREQMIAVTHLTTQQTDAGANMPELRKKEAEAAAGLQRLKLAYNSLEAEERQVIEAQTRATEAMAQIDADIAHENNFKVEAADTVTRLSAERDQLQSENDGAENGNAALAEERDALHGVVSTLDAELSQAAREQAGADATRNSLEQQKQQAARRRDEVAARIENLVQQRQQLLADSSLHADIETVDAEIASQENSLVEAQTALESASAAVVAAQDSEAAAAAAESEAQGVVRQAQDGVNSLQTEINTLTRLIKSGEVDGFAPALESITVQNGFERALAVALGDDLQAALDTDAPAYWRATGNADAPVFPSGITPLLSVVTAPDALTRALSFVGVADSFDAALSAAATLAPGQCLVTRDGYAVRWDGFTLTPEMTPAAAVRLEQKNRLAALETELPAKQADVEAASAVLADARETLQTARTNRTDAVNAERAARENVRSVEGSLSQLRTRLARLHNDASAITSRVSSMDANIESAKEESARLSETLERLEGEYASLPDMSALQDRIATLRDELTAKRDTLADVQSRLLQATREAETRTRRITDIARDLESWQSRLTRVDTRLSELAERAEQNSETLSRLSERPAQIENEKHQLLSLISDSDANRQVAADALQEAENGLNDLNRLLKDAESILADAREARAMAQANVSTAEVTRTNIEQQIAEKFSTTPESLFTQVGINPETDEIPDLPTVQGKLERLVRERDNMGPVNLRAEVEAEEIGTTMNTMTGERDDLIAAINRLRQGIGMLNKEARERLLEAFERVNQSFSELFVRLFGGGSAHLKLLEADDPLEAGLEIYAQPPGKKLQVLSLLSGGEQTLTSISLIFAMFMSNPAPICVLDEIDAPLDESNVDRVCSLLEEITSRLNTRFIVISHHRMTMSRMDRLYGVTMAERGVSQLVSVDLKQKDLPFDDNGNFSVAA